MVTQPFMPGTHCLFRAALQVYEFHLHIHYVDTTRNTCHICPLFCNISFVPKQGNFPRDKISLHAGSCDMTLCARTWQPFWGCHVPRAQDMLSSGWRRVPQQGSYPLLSPFRNSHTVGTSCAKIESACAILVFSVSISVRTGSSVAPSAEHLPARRSEVDHPPLLRRSPDQLPSWGSRHCESCPSCADSACS